MNSNTSSIRKEIVEKADIVNIVSQYVKLEKKGNNYIGLCPFHEDKNPSMSVSPQKKVFKCFSCGTAGDVVTFVSKFKNITISEAMREIGETVGIKVAMSQKDILKQKNLKYYNVLSEAATFYNFFLTNTVEGKVGINYLMNRKLSENDIKRFNIGFAGDNDVLYKTLNSKGYLPLDMIEVGLLRGGDRYHDVFRNRIIFPLKDLEGNVVGFSGRRFLPINENESKYINTNDTILFKKSEILYNYSDCINDIKANNNVYLFEGFMDVIAAVRANVNNSIATMGTALTINQINSIKKITNNIVLCMDSDGPGVQATIKAIYLLNNAGMNINVVSIPEVKDPDEYISKYGNEKLHDVLVNNFVSAIEFLYNYEKKNSDFSNFNSIESFKSNVFKHLSILKSNILKEKILKNLSNDLNVSIDNLLSDYNKTKEKVEIEAQTIEESKKIVTNNNQKSSKRFEYSKSKYLSSERKLLKACYFERKTCFEIESMLENCYYDSTNLLIISKLSSYFKIHDIMTKEVFFDTLSDDEKVIMQSILDEETLPASNKEIRSLVANIKKWPFHKVINNMHSKDEKTLEDLQRITEYKQKITIIKKNKE